MIRNVKKASITRTYHTANGALIKGTRIRIEETNMQDKKMRVSDDVGRLFWVNMEDVKLIN